MDSAAVIQLGEGEELVAGTPFEQEYVALDLETTGLDSNRDTIIEIGAVKFQGEDEIDIFRTFVNPGRTIPEFVQRLTGITPRQVQRAPSFPMVAGELGDFIEQPMRTYSSGMYVRLGFAVAVHVHPEILVVDEVLAVGDAEFQSKCFAHIRKLREDGVTIIIASHDLASLRRYTDRVILLEHGEAVLQGDPAEVTHAYLTRVFGSEAKAKEAQ